MKKTISLFLTALILCTALSLPAFAAEEPAPGKDNCYYPVSVEEYTYGPPRRVPHRQGVPAVPGRRPRRYPH